MASAETELVIADRFRVLRMIGKGGMGAVFEAVHVHTGRRLAIKTLLPELTANPTVVARFMREARSAASIGDSHVVNVIDLGRAEDGSVYLALEYLEGHELRDAIRKQRPLAIGRVAHIGMQLAAVMGKAHGRGIVHRDLKPANIFLIERDGDPDYVKVLDFGIAKLLVDDGPGDVQLTHTSQILGTPLYMAPEQLQGARGVDARADVYALGVILYQMLAGSLPFLAETVPDIFLKIMTTQPTPLAQKRPDAPTGLVAVVERAMARAAAERYATGAELAAALAPWAADWRPGMSVPVLAAGPAMAGDQPMVTPATTQTPVSYPVPVPVPAGMVAPPRVPRAVVGGGVAVAAVVAAALAVMHFRSPTAPAPVASSLAAARPPPAQAAAPPPARPATPAQPPAAAPAAAAVERVTVRFVGAPGATITVADGGTCTTPCALELPRSGADRQATATLADGRSWALAFTADAARDVTVTAPSVPPRVGPGARVHPHRPPAGPLLPQIDTHQ